MSDQPKPSQPSQLDAYEEEPAEYHDQDCNEDFSKNKYASVQVDLIKKLIELGLTMEQLQSSDKFEQLILQLAKQNEDCSDIPDIQNGDCGFIWKIMPLSNFVIINYKTLSEEQVSKIAKFYREKYNMESYTLGEFETMLYEQFGSYLTGHIRGEYKLTNAICLDLTPLCEKVFPDLKAFI